MARQGNPEHLAGCMLHWGEGSNARNSVVFTNSDPEMLRGPCEVEDERIALSVNCHLNNGLAVAEIDAWWLAQLGLPASALRAATVNRPFLIQSIHGAIQEYAGFDHPEWLD